MPVVAGEHTLGIRAVYTPTEDDFVAEGDISGIVLEQTLPLEVSPLAVEFLDLQIDKSVAQAGEDIPYRVWALDRYGNRVRDPAIESELKFLQTVSISQSTADKSTVPSQTYMVSVLGMATLETQSFWKSFPMMQMPLP